MGHLTTALGQRIKELRKAKKLTQAQLSEAIGMETTNLCKLENGGQLPKEENIEKIASVLEVSIKDLFDFNHLKSRDILENELISAIKNASDKDVELYHRIVFSLVQHY